MNKRGIEFAISTVVMIIIGIIIFILSVSMVFKWFGSATQLQGEIDKQTQDQLMQSLRSGNQLVIIPFSIQDVKRGAFATFAIGVRNIGETKQFTIITTFDDAYTPDGRAISSKNAAYIEQKWLGNFHIMPPFSLKKAAQDIRPLPIKIDVSSAPSIQTPVGDYVFNVCVWASDTGGTPPDCKPENRKLFYTEKVYQVTARVT